MHKRIIATVAALTGIFLIAGAGAANAGTTVPGQTDRSGDVTGHYTETAFGCDYVVNYRGDFGGDEYLNSGWIRNVISCPDGQYTYLIVSESDPRYTGNPEREIWGTWEIVNETWSGVGNVANPMHPEYAYAG